MKTKSQTISEIIQLNPSVGAAFLSEFTRDELSRYLLRLRDVLETRYTFQVLEPDALRREPEALQSA